MSVVSVMLTFHKSLFFFVVRGRMSGLKTNNDHNDKIETLQLVSCTLYTHTGNLDKITINILILSQLRILE